MPISYIYYTYTCALKINDLIIYFFLIFLNIEKIITVKLLYILFFKQIMYCNT